MARSLTWTIALLTVLLGLSVHAVAENACTEFPYAQLESYPPVQTWCSSHYPINGLVTAAPQPMSCQKGDYLCPVFSAVQSDVSTAASILCSCIEKTNTEASSISSATRSCSASPVTVTSTSPPQTTTVTATFVSSLPVQTITITSTVINTPPAQTITTTATSFATLSPSTTTYTVTTTIAMTHTPGCTPNPQLPANTICDFSAIYAGGGIDVLSTLGTTVSSLSACEQQCLSTTQCVSFSFDGANCVLYSQSVSELELQGLAFPVDSSVAGSTNFYDSACYTCG